MLRLPTSRPSWAYQRCRRGLSWCGGRLPSELSGSVRCGERPGDHSNQRGLDLGPRSKLPCSMNTSRLRFRPEPTYYRGRGQGTKKPEVVSGAAWFHRTNRLQMRATPRDRESSNPKIWLPKSSVLQIILSRFLNVSGDPEMDSNSLYFTAGCLRSPQSSLRFGETSSQICGRLGR